MPKPLLVVVTGMPAAGKTTVAEGLARELRLPLIAKDAIKESLYDSLGVADAHASGELGRAAYALIFALARVQLAQGVSLVVEGNFFADQAADVDALPDHRLVQIHCDAPLETLITRYAGRVRHPGHNDGEKLNGLAERHASGAHAPLALRGHLIRLDTREPPDARSLAAAVLRFEPPGP